MRTVSVRHGGSGGSKVHLREGVCGKLEHAEVGDGGRVEAAARDQHHRPPRHAAPAQSLAFHTQPKILHRCSLLQTLTPSRALSFAPFSMHSSIAAPRVRGS